MDIVFASRKLEKLCNDDRKATREWGRAQADLMGRRLDDLYAAPCLEDLRNGPGDPHELKRDRVGQIAMDLVGGDRLIFEPANDPVPRKPDGGLDWRLVTAVRILGVEDYHD